jgi:hypothetical protein
MRYKARDTRYEVRSMRITLYGVTHMSIQTTGCQTFCPVVRIGSPHPPSGVAPPLFLGSKGGETLTCGAGVCGTQFRRRDRHSDTLVCMYSMLTEGDPRYQIMYLLGNPNDPVMQYHLYIETVQYIECNFPFSEAIFFFLEAYRL